MSTNKNWHWIYNYAFVSIFVGTYLLVHFYEKTIIPLYIVIGFIILSAGLFALIIKFKPFKKIPLLAFPFFFLSLFGVGVNLATILLICNFYISPAKTSETHIYQKDELETIKLTAFTTEKGKVIYDFTFKIKFNTIPTKKRVSLSANNAKIKELHIHTKQGLLGYRVITKKEVL